jgi:hypothetical protein
LLSQQADINAACRSIKIKVATTALVRERTQIPLVYGHATIIDPDINNVGGGFHVDGVSAWQLHHQFFSFLVSFL